MKKFVIILILLGYFGSAISQNQASIDLNWTTNYEDAKNKAMAQNKHILIYFTGSDWSKPCKLLNKEFFYTEKFQKIAEQNLILLRVNSPKRPDLISNLQKEQNSELSKLYGQKVHPTVVLTKANGQMVGMIESYNYLHDTSKHYALVAKANRK